MLSFPEGVSSYTKHPLKDTSMINDLKASDLVRTLVTGASHVFCIALSPLDVTRFSSGAVFCSLEECGSTVG